MNDAIRHQIRSLRTSGDLLRLAAYCQEVLSKDITDDFLRGCCLWNLSDVYAMKRDYSKLYHNHRCFEAQLNTMPPMYHLWLVCDATQRLTLELSGYDDFWWKMYEMATDDSRDIAVCAPILFETHRAAFYPNPQKPCSPSLVLQVSDRFVRFLKKVSEADDHAFYRLIYTSLCLTQFGDTDANMLDMCEHFMSDLKQPAAHSNYITGEWHTLNSKRSKQNMARVGITSAVNALIRCGNMYTARELYLTARHNGLPPDHYIETRLK